MLAGLSGDEGEVEGEGELLAVRGLECGDALTVDVEHDGAS